jgi:hypothetical protein
MLVTPSNAGIDTTFISFAASSGNAAAVSVYTTSNTKVGTYNIQITGAITAASIWTQTTSFTLTVTGSCLYSTEAITVTASPAIS